MGAKEARKRSKEASEAVEDLAFPPLRGGLLGIVGHPRPVSVLRRSLDSGRLHHAYLLIGPSGVGKRTCGKALAQALCCVRNPGVGCGECNPCHRIERLIHPDYLEIRPDGQYIKVGQIRELEARLELGPYESRAVTAVISPAERMNIAAANALLKVLEEPRPSVHFVLASSAPHSLPATVRSRCQPIRFGPIPKDELESFIQERLGLSQSEAELLSGLSDGSLGRAAVLFSQKGAGEQRRWAERLCNVAGRKAKALEVFGLAEELAELGDELPRVLELVQVYLRDLLWLTLEPCGAGSAAKGRVVNQDLMEGLAERACGLHSQAVLIWAHAVRRALRMLKRNANRRICMEELLWELTGL